MKRVVIQYDDKVKFFENVTKVQCFCGLDISESHLDIWQGKKKTVIKMFDVIGFEIK